MSSAVLTCGTKCYSASDLFSAADETQQYSGETALYLSTLQTSAGFLRTFRNLIKIWLDICTSS